MTGGGAHDRGGLCSQERVGLPLQSQVRWQRALSAGPQGLHFGNSSDKCGIFRLDRFGESQIVLGVLVGTVDERRIGKGCQALQRAIHLFRGSFEDPTAAGGEQGIAAEQAGSIAVGLEIGDMAAGVPRDLQRFELAAQHLDSVAVTDSGISHGDALLVRPDHAGPGGCLERLDPADVIRMVMGDENIAELPPRVLAQPVKDGRCVSGVDYGAAPLLPILQQPDVVVLKCSQCFDVDHDTGRERSPPGT